MPFRFQPIALLSKCEANEDTLFLPHQMATFVEPPLQSSTAMRAPYHDPGTHAVLERYTERLTRNVSNLAGIEIAFQHLKDTRTEHLSSEKAMAAMENAVVGAVEPSQSSTISELGLDVLIWHASFPFPPALEPPGSCDGIDQSSFTRAVCLLALRSVPGYGGRKRWGTWFPANPFHAGFGGYWGPHHGSYVSKRGKGASDFMRRIFRSLAAYHDDDATDPRANGTGKAETPIPVLRFMYRVQLPKNEEGTKAEDEEDEEDEEPEIQEFAIMESEPEVTIDIQDVMSECPPEEDRLTANPFRESYSLALPGLPHPEHDLTELRVPVSKVSALLTLAKQLNATGQHSGQGEGEIDDPEALIGRLSGKTSLGWEEFQTNMRGYEDMIADALAKMVGLLVETCGGPGNS
ncbi:hypothetical protein PG984_013821 [Apiospora sp. TS-2023a]